ncbi:Alpha/beta hydrolase family protein [Rubripirellula tenax]|uniref:Alpha/beta hydrolase family protein n=2 Tax=Rubripirellula tenax TaxID=2528015 RepID=A0A5C6FKY4_9BACT|nr:Alpha/beta hydrolase family protein [Rubripirellula tenax]
MFTIAIIPYVVVVAVVFFFQRHLLYFPSHHDGASRLSPWIESEQAIGFCREVPDATTIWLMTHGNGGQAADRDYVLGRMSETDSLYVLEYPGYGAREGKPTRASINQTAADAYRLLRSRNPNATICVLGESLGSGPACSLAKEATPPDKIVLVVPFESLASVAAKRFFFLPVRLLLLDRWDNVAALKDYQGPVEIFGATNDEIIPVKHAKTLTEQVTGARFTPIPGGHNDWSLQAGVKIQR